MVHRMTSAQVLLSGHIPPGMLARVAHFSWYVPQFNSRLVALLQQYHDVITAFITGHEHTDGFHIINGNEGNQYSPLVPVLMAPAVTPWRSTIPGMGANNPGIRLYTYDRRTGTPLDFRQFFLNLTAANGAAAADWQLEYRASEAYNLSALTARALHGLASSFLRADDEFFKRYYAYNTVSYDLRSDCSSECKQSHICAILFVDYDQYQKCMHKYEREHLVPYRVHHADGANGSEASLAPAVVATGHRANVTHLFHGHAPHPYPPGPRPAPQYHKAGYMHYVIYGLVSLVVVLFLIITLLCCCFRPNNRVVYFTQPRYVLVS